jgi:hypothetical protein
MMQAVGFEPELQFMDAPAYTALRREEGWDGLLICNYITFFNNEDTPRINFMHIPGVTPNWVSVIPSEEFTELLELPMFVGDNTAEIMIQSDYILEHMMIIPLWYQGQMHIVHPRVAGWLPEDHMLFFERLWLLYD